MRRLCLAVAAVLCLSAFDCSIGETLDVESNCKFKQDMNWSQQGYKVQPRMPQFCDVFTDDVDVVGIANLPSRDYILDVWDDQNKASFVQQVFTSFKSAGGVFTGSTYAQFSPLYIGQPNGELAVSLSGSYHPGNAGFGITTPKIDTAYNYTYVSGTTLATVSVLLPYRLETTPYMSGPTSVAFGSTGGYGLVATEMRQAPTYAWYQDGQLQGENRSYYTASFSTSGAHNITAKTTSAIGTIFWTSKDVQVTLPDGCGGGGGGIPLTSCPPQ